MKNSEDWPKNCKDWPRDGKDWQFLAMAYFGVVPMGKCAGVRSHTCTLSLFIKRLLWRTPGILSRVCSVVSLFFQFAKISHL